VPTKAFCSHSDQSLDVTVFNLARLGQFREFLFHVKICACPAKNLATGGVFRDGSPMIAKTPREIALHTLRRWEQGDTHAATLLSGALPALEGRNRALCQELVYGVIRQCAALDWLIEERTDGRKQPSLVQMLLRLGIYQIFWLDRVPGHAAVNETVALAHRCDVGRATGFINAVLRQSLRETDTMRAALEALRETHPAIVYSHPDWLVRRWQAQWGRPDAITLLKWNNQPADNYIRLNSLRPHLSKPEGEPIKFDWAKKSIRCLAPNSIPATLPGFAEGAFYIQDPSTLLAVDMLNPRPGEAVLDLCAAPGGKTTAIAAHMKNDGRVVATDIREDRLKQLRENCKRLGADCVEVMPLGTDVREKFDRVLADVPCSNTGVMRRRVDLRWRLQPRDLQAVVKIQREILRRAARNVKPGGLLVYSTCSLEPEENEQIVKAFLERNGAFGLEAERALLPWHDGVDGAYVAALRLAPA